MTILQTSSPAPAPIYVVNYVNHEKLSKQLNSEYRECKHFITDQLDKQQLLGDGGMTVELMKDMFSNTIFDKLSAMETAIHKMRQMKQNPALGCDNVVPYVLPTIIHPLAMWQQWHHGASFKDGIVVGPLKNIPQSNCPEKYR